MTINSGGAEEWRHAPFHDMPIGHATSGPKDRRQFPYFAWRTGYHDPLAELGCVLASAIWNGALLDPRKWQPWLAGLKFKRFSGRQQWVPLRLVVRREGFAPQHLQDRWFADPSTGMHLWMLEQNGTTVDDPQAIEILEAFFHATGWKWRSVEEFLNASCARWRLRLPPLLYDYAVGRTGTTSLSEYSWCRLIGIKPNTAFRQAFVPRVLLEEFRALQKASFRRLGASFPVAYRVFDDVRRLQRRGVIDKMASARRLCAEWLLNAIDRNTFPMHRTLIQWCAFRLRQKRSAKSRRGYAPSTMYFRLSCVFSMVLAEAAGNRRFVLDLISLKRVAARALSKHTNPYMREEIEAGCADLFDYLYEIETGQPLPRGPRRTPKESNSRSPQTSDDLDDDETESEYLASEEKAPRGVCADIVSETVFTDLLEHISQRLDAPEGALVVAILAYRCGLRLTEITGARIGDFVSGENFLELQLDRSSQRWLKTFDSRRVLPLHVFLSEAELKIVEGHLRLRLLSSEILQRNLPFLGPICARALPEGKRFEDFIDHCLEILGYKGLKFQNFRHSFGSLTLTNLLLPDDFHGDEVVHQLSHSLSLDRRNRLLDALVGRERLGQASLHAVSLAMGHTGIQMTLDAYQHLLNLSLGLYVESRTQPWVKGSANENGATGEVEKGRPTGTQKGESKALYLNPIQTQTYLRGSSASLSKKAIFPLRPDEVAKKADAISALQAKSEFLASHTLHHKRNLDWFVIFHLATADDEVAKKLRRLCGVDARLAAQWRRLAEGLAIKLSNSRKNTCLTLPRGAEALWQLNKMWSGLPARLTELERRLVATFVWNFDKRNSYARFLNVADALSCRRMLISWGANPWDLWVDEARGLNARSSASRDDVKFDRSRAGYDGYGAISIERDKTFTDSAGWSSDLKRHRRPKRSKKTTDYPRHRHVVYAYKFFLAMVVLRENIKPLKLPHANKGIYRP